MKLLVELGLRGVEFVVFLVRYEDVPGEVHVFRVDVGLVGKIGKVGSHDAVSAQTMVMEQPWRETPAPYSCAGNPAQGSSAFRAERGSTMTYRSGVQRN